MKIKTPNTLESLERYSFIAKDLLRFYLPNYQIHWLMSINQTARCWNGSRKLIEINVYDAVAHGEDELIESVLHEIAHGLTKEGHTARWKECYKSIGGNGSVTLEESLRLTSVKDVAARQR